MGIQATFCGLMYNECFSLSMNLVGTGYTCDENTYLCEKHSTYWLGVDPVWRQTYNNLIFTNSVKMKISIIVGVSQMVIGIFFSFLNHKEFKKKINIYCEFIPQMLLMLSLFGFEYSMYLL
jgi:V-type H+-transporting ATPase subunit a